MAQSCWLIIDGRNSAWGIDNQWNFQAGNFSQTIICGDLRHLADPSLTPAVIGTISTFQKSGLWQIINQPTLLPYCFFSICSTQPFYLASVY
jgi:hypothetical protein